MILQALVNHYEDLLARGDISRPGWGKAKVSFALSLSETGELLALIPMKTSQQQRKKTVLASQIMDVPMPVSRTMGVLPNFLCDHSGYLLGIDNKGKPARTRECFEHCKSLHFKLLQGVDHSAAHAVTAFFQQWEPEHAAEHPLVKKYLEELFAGANLIFWYESAPVSSIPSIQAAWQRHYDVPADGPVLPCLVTGRAEPAALTHPLIKGVRDAQSGGAALVSYNAPAFCSYGKEQNANAPVSKYAAFAYTTALNSLLADKEHVRMLGNTTVLCWAEGGDPAYQDAATMGMFGGDESMTDGDLRSIFESIAKGLPMQWKESTLDPDRPFYVLGLSPNAGRLSVRFFLRNSFGGFIQNIQAHYDRLEIVRPKTDKFATLPPWKLLAETVNPNARDKSSSEQMSGDVLRSIWYDLPYPATLINGVMLRLRAERELPRAKAAIIKAYYLKNEHPDCSKEVLTMELNEQSTYLPYLLGRLFSVLEDVQHAANPGINATIKDKYFTSAAATPATVFPLLLNLAQKHLRKIEGIGLRVKLEKQIGKLMEHIDQDYPTRMTLPQQGAFHIGYYHQTQKRYQGANKEEN
jgi:CRISPR-associated protein Csd1